MKNIAYAGLGLIIVLVGVFLFSKSKSSNDTIIPKQIPIESTKQSLLNQNQSTKSSMNIPFNILPKEEIVASKAKLKTSKGVIDIELFSDAPIASSNFIQLAKKGFYDGVIFHRVIKGFMIQGGDPTGTGTSGPGYSFQDELDPDAVSYQKGYKRGIVAMANAGPNTNGSQFFIMHQDYQLPHNYTIFGQVTSGMDVVDAIAESEVDAGDKPVQSVVMEKVSID